MRHPSQPDTQPDEYIPDLPSAHRPQPDPVEPGGEAITPTEPSTMPRGERDHVTRERSPEFNDRRDAPSRPDR